MTIVDIGHYASTGLAGREYPELDDETHNPVDRTVCPHCLGLEPDRHHCHVCHGAAVCPTCRNGRVLRIQESRFPAYRVCDDCCDAQDANDRASLPVWIHRPSRQTDTIRAYRARRWRERESAMAARDPWDETPR